MMKETVRGLLVEKGGERCLWIGEFRRGRLTGQLGFPGGKTDGDERAIPALLSELQEETGLPAEAFDVSLLRPVEVMFRCVKVYCFFVWLMPGFIPRETEEMGDWRKVSVTEVLAETRMAAFCHEFLLDWLSRPNWPLKI